MERHKMRQGSRAVKDPNWFRDGERTIKYSLKAVHISVIKAKWMGREKWISLIKDEQDLLHKKLQDQRVQTGFAENDKYTDSLYCCTDYMLLH